MYRLGRKQIASFLLAGSAVLCAAPAAFAQPAPAAMHGHGDMMHGPGPMMRGGPMMHLRALGLSEAQQDQVFKIFHEQAPAMHEQRKQMRRAREELRKLASAERVDAARVRQLADALGKAIAEMAVMRVQTMHRVREILTAEQRARLDQFAARRGAMGAR